MVKNGQKSAKNGKNAEIFFFSKNHHNFTPFSPIKVLHTILIQKISFLGGNPLNFRDQTRTGVFILVWP